MVCTTYGHAVKTYDNFLDEEPLDHGGITDAGEHLDEMVLVEFATYKGAPSLVVINSEGGPSTAFVSPLDAITPTDVVICHVHAANPLYADTSWSNVCMEIATGAIETEESDLENDLLLDHDESEIIGNEILIYHMLMVAIIIARNDKDKEVIIATDVESTMYMADKLEAR